MPTHNEIHNKIDALVNDLCKLTDDSARSEAMAAYVTAISKFHKYSFFNAWLIMFHNPDATRVAGFRAWNKFNRYVRKGEHGIPILVLDAPHPAYGVDTPEDLQRVAEIMEQRIERDS